MDNNQKEQMKKTVRDLASHTEKAASMAKDKISQQMEQENVKKAAETAAKGARKASSGISAFWKKRTRKQKVILAVLAVVLVCGIFAGGGGGAGSGKVSSETDGMKVLRAMFPESQYNIKFEKEIFPCSGMFEGEVGKYIGSSWQGESIRAYAYSVTAKDRVSNPYSYGVFWVAENGRVIGYGPMVSGSTSSDEYRVK